MLYQTLPLCCPFNLSSTTFSSTLHSFSSSVSVTASSCPLPPPCPCCCPSSSQVQAKAEMDCIEAKALKGSSTEVAFMKSSQQAIHEYSWVANGPSTVVSADDLFVDEFLEFPNDDVEEGLCKEEEEEEEGDKPCSSVSFPAEQPLHENSNSNSAIFSVPELSVPADDLADLEWLSHFVEDSFLEFSSVPYPSTSTPKEENQNGNQNLTEQGTERASVKQPNFCFPTPVPCKARSKRPRTGGRTRTWSIGSLSFTESSSTYSSSSTSSTTTTSSYSSPMSLLTLPEKGHNMDMLYYLEKPAVKKPKKEKRKLVGEASGNRQQQQQQQQPQAPRRCSHCHVQKTPQWRAGPLGAKTLCNACGVRYKSGRLLPEYRPACSPTFSGDIHSNSHRKVLEMRRKKESGFTGIEISSWVPAVQSW